MRRNSITFNLVTYFEPLALSLGYSNSSNPFVGSLVSTSACAELFGSFQGGDGRVRGRGKEGFGREFEGELCSREGRWECGSRWENNGRWRRGKEEDRIEIVLVM